MCLLIPLLERNSFSSHQCSLCGILLSLCKRVLSDTSAHWLSPCAPLLRPHFCASVQKLFPFISSTIVLWDHCLFDPLAPQLCLSGSCLSDSVSPATMNGCFSIIDDRRGPTQQEPQRKANTFHGRGSRCSPLCLFGFRSVRQCVFSHTQLLSSACQMGEWYELFLVVKRSSEIVSAFSQILYALQGRTLIKCLEPCTIPLRCVGIPLIVDALSRRWHTSSQLCAHPQNVSNFCEIVYAFSRFVYTSSETVHISSATQNTLSQSYTFPLR